MDPRLREAFRFMLNHAGYSVPPGRATCALDLARAELRAKDEGLRYYWDHDGDAFTTATDEQQARVMSGETVYLDCVVYDADGRHSLASLGGIEVANFGDPYCRVVEAELASEAFYALDHV